MLTDTNSFIMSLSAFQFIGIAGFLTYIGGFTALQLKLLDGNSLAYSMISVFAASMVLISLSENFNLASALIQVSWITIGSVGIILRLVQRKIASLPK